jgi:ABC-type cobalamin/Fe3+-siderophores transport system ATPase subunit
MIQICDLTVGYGKKSVVGNINQEFSKGEFISLLGPNGSGKTTILRTLSRLLSPIKGVVKINGLADRYLGELSDGEKKKIVLARALAQEPEIMILDEPTLHLDLKHRIEVMSILQKFCREKGITVIVSLYIVPTVNVRQ